MKAPVYIEILERTLVPFLRQKFPALNSHRFMQEYDPKHTSRATQYILPEQRDQLVAYTTRITGHESNREYVTRTQGVH